jgi:hypothetical protein
MVAILAGFGSFALAVVTQPIDRLFGRPGLIGLALIAGFAAAWLARRLRSRVLA